MKKIVFWIGCCLSATAFSWNAQGHQLIAQIAYDHLTPKAKRTFTRYNRIVNKTYPTKNWVHAAVWLDLIRYQHNATLNAMHYIDLPFSDDGTPLSSIPAMNAVVGIERSIQTLRSNASDFKKGMALRVLLHVVGDVHQPMHTITRVSRAYPEGDRGGNLVALPRNAVAKNLHAYWDYGGGFLGAQGKKKRKQVSLKKRATELEREYPCSTLPLTLSPSEWAKESHEYAVWAYKGIDWSGVSGNYQYQTTKIVKNRLALAGCRLAALLNSL